MQSTFVGFGAIQSGLFLFEAFQTVRFDRLVVAEVMPETIRKVRENGGCYRVNVATENNNHAAEIFADHFNAAISDVAAAEKRIQFLNTVVGKMSGVVTDADQIREQHLAPLTPEADSAFLVEAFNRILITRVTLPDAQRNITVFEEKDDLYPFEEAKLYGHNATHALIG